MKKLKLVSLLLNTPPPPLASSLLYYYFILILWTFFCFFDKTRKRCSLRVITSTNKISAGAIQSCIFKQVKELTIWMVNLSSLFFSHEYVSYAFIASPMSHLWEPLLWIKLNDYVIPFFFADDPEYQKVFATLDELNLGHLRPVFKGKHLRVRSQIWEYLAIRSWFILCRTIFGSSTGSWANNLCWQNS